MKEKRLIDVDDLIDFINMGHLRNPLESCFSERDVVDMLESRPTVDAIPVIKCRDCKHWGDQDGILQDSDGKLFARCKVHNYLIDGRHTGWCPSENDFCSYGEKRRDKDGTT